ncbi:relaxase/mobilization nuclease domain-containing protein [Gordonia malaquae]|uniref:relaxase/mobilization nuclease domain-containing protein n=1 Tax=Gordonia malaquae TaxID=410332 RepID=UPI0030C789E3
MAIVEGGPTDDAAALDFYISNSPAHDGSNERWIYESTIGDCSTSTFIDDMRRTRALYGKSDLKVETYHYILSWSHEEIDPNDEYACRLAHEAAEAWAKQAFPGRQIKLTTQRDGLGGKVHTHIQVASVAYTDAEVRWTGKGGTPMVIRYAAGRAIDGPMKNLARLREINDRVVAEKFGYDNKEFVDRRGRQGGRWTAEDARKNADGKYNYRLDAQDRISTALSLATSFDDYRTRLQVAGVTLHERSKEKNLSYEFIDRDGNRRRMRAGGRSGLGGDYMRASVDARIERNAEKVAAGETLTAPDRSAAIPWSLGELERPIYHAPDGSLTPGDPPGSVPQWKIDRDAAMADFAAGATTYEGRARKTIDAALADEAVDDDEALVSVAARHGATVDLDDDTVTVDGVTMGGDRLGADYTAAELRAMIADLMDDYTEEETDERNERDASGTVAAPASREGSAASREGGDAHTGAGTGVDTGAGTGADAVRGGAAVPGTDGGGAAGGEPGRGDVDLGAAAGDEAAAAGAARGGGTGRRDGAAGEGADRGGAAAIRGAASGRGRASGSSARVDTRGALNDSIERKARKHRTKTDAWIDTVAERVEDRLDRDVQVAARRISQSQSLMEGLAWLLVLYMEQRQQADALRAWATEKRATMTAPVERPLSGPLAGLSDDALRFLSTHEDGAAAGYEQFAEERYEAYAGRKRAAGEMPRPMADYYGIPWGDAVQAARGEAAVGGSLPVPARDFLLDTGHFDRFIAWRASTDRRAWSQPLKAADIATMEPPVAAAAEVAPEFVRYIAMHSLTDTYAQRAKHLRDVRHATDDFYTRTVDEAADQRTRDQRRATGAEATLPAPTTTGFVD